MSAVSHLNYGLWRHPDDQSWRHNQLTHWTALARTVEAAGFDTLFLADALGLLATYAGNADASLRTGTQAQLSDRAQRTLCARRRVHGGGLQAVGSLVGR